MIDDADTPGIIAVLTGDLVDSSALDPEQLGEVTSAIQAGAERAAVVTGRADLLIGAVDVFRGDSWQLAVRHPECALMVAICCRLATRARRPNAGQGGFDSRIAIAVGRATSVDPERISRSSGPVFEASGELLDSLSHSALRVRDLTAGLPASSSTCSIGSSLPVVAHLTGELLGIVSPRQAEAVLAWLGSGDQTLDQLGGELDPPVGKATLSQLLRRGFAEPLAAGASAWAADVASLLKSLSNSANEA